MVHIELLISRLFISKDFLAPLKIFNPPPLNPHTFYDFLYSARHTFQEFSTLPPRAQLSWLTYIQTLDFEDATPAPNQRKYGPTGFYKANALSFALPTDIAELLSSTANHALARENIMQSSHIFSLNPTL